MKRKILRKTRIVTILSALVVFLTVYSLVLPAVTLTDDAATEDPGINTSETTNVAEVEKLSLNEEKSSDVEIETTEQAEEDVQKEEVKEEKKVVENVSYPAVSFSDSLGDMIVYVEAPEGAFPENTQMQLKEVEDEAALVDSINSNLENKEVKAIKAVDITFIYNNEEFEPLKPIKVSMTSSFIESNKEDEQLLVHVDNDNDANIVETTEVKEKDVEVINNVEEVQTLVENTDEINEITTDNTVAFESDAFSVYAVVYTVDFECEGYTYSIEGGTSISLSRLFEVLGISNKVNEVKEVTFSNSELIELSKTDNDWILNSLKAFSSQEILEIVLENKKITIYVSDAQDETGVWDLADTNNTKSLHVSADSSITQNEQERDAAFKLSFTYSLKEDVVRAIDDYDQPFNLVYDLNSLIDESPIDRIRDNLNGVISIGSRKLGTYKVESGIITLHFTDTTYFDGRIDFSGFFNLTVETNETELGTNDEWTYKFPGTSDTIPVHYKKQVEEGTKSVNSVKDSEGNYTLSYNATINVNTELSSMTFSDTLSGLQSLDSSSVKINGNRVDNIQQTGQNFSFDIASALGITKVEKGSYNVTYETKVTEEQLKAMTSDKTLESNKATWIVNGDKNVPGGETKIELEKPKEPIPVTKTISSTSNQPGDTVTYTVTYGKETTALSGFRISDYMTDAVIPQGEVELSYNGQTQSIGFDSQATDQNYSKGLTTLFDYTFPEGTAGNGPVTVSYSVKLIDTETAKNNGIYDETDITNIAQEHRQNTTDTKKTTVSYEKEPRFTVEKAVIADPDNEKWVPETLLSYTLTIGDSESVVSGINIKDTMSDLQKLVGDVLIKVGNDAPVKLSEYVADSIKWIDDGNYSSNDVELFNFNMPSDAGHGPVVITYQTRVISQGDATNSGIYGEQNIKNTGTSGKDQDGTSGTGVFESYPIKKIVTQSEQNVNGQTVQSDSTVHYSLTFGTENMNMGGVYIQDEMTDLQKLSGDITITKADGTSFVMPIGTGQWSQDGNNWPFLDDGKYSNSMILLFKYKLPDDIGYGPIKVDYDARIISEDEAKKSGVIDTQPAYNKFSIGPHNTQTEIDIEFPKEVKHNPQVRKEFDHWDVENSKVYWNIIVEKDADSAYPLENVTVQEAWDRNQVSITEGNQGYYGYNSFNGSYFDITNAVVTTDDGTVLTPGVDYTIDKATTKFTFAKLNERVHINLAFLSPAKIIDGYYMENKVRLNNGKEGDAKQTYNKPEVEAVKNGKYNEDSRIVTWEVQINPKAKQFDISDENKYVLLFEDYIPEGLTILNYENNTESNPSVHVAFGWRNYNAPITAEVQADGATKITGDIHPKHVTWDGQQDNSDVSLSGEKVVVTYKTKLSEAEWDRITSSASGSETFQNNVTITAGDNEKFDATDKVTVTSDGYITKEDTTKEEGGVVFDEETDQNSKNITYSIEINPHGYALNNGDTLSLTDYIATNMDLDSTSVSISNATLGDDGKLHAGDTVPVGIEVSYNDDSRLLSIREIPDRTPLLLTYTCIARAQGTDTFKNTATLIGGGSHSASTSENHTVQSNDAGVKVEGIEMSLLKIDENNISKTLKNASFQLYECELEIGDMSEYDQHYWSELLAKVDRRTAGSSSMEDDQYIDENFKIIGYNPVGDPVVTGDKGYTQFSSLGEHKLYAWKEVGYPEGYVGNDDYHYFVVYQHINVNSDTVPQPLLSDDEQLARKQAAWALDDAAQFANDIRVASMSNLTTWTATNIESDYTSITVSKEWKGDSDNLFETRPLDGIHVQLIRINPDGTQEDVGDPISINADDKGEWPTYIWSKLPSKDYNGNTYLYTVKESKVENYLTEYSDNGEGQASGTITVTNTMIPKSTDITVKKVFNKKVFNGDVEKPLEIKVALKVIKTDKNGVVYPPEDTDYEARLNETNNWEWKFDKLPTSFVDSNGNGYVLSYTAVEDLNALEAEGYHYIASYSDNGEGITTAGDLIITNSKEIGSVKITKVFDGIGATQIPSDFVIHASWMDEQNVQQTRDLSINGDLPANVTRTGEDLLYTWTISDLPLNTEVTFIEENFAVEGYTVQADSVQKTAVSSLIPGEAEITNKYQEQPKTGSLKIKKNVSIPSGTDSSKADGHYHFEVWDYVTNEPILVNEKDDDIEDIVIEIKNGESNTYTVDGLRPGKYIVKEDVKDSDNKTVILDTESADYNKEAGGIIIEVIANNSSSVPIAEFTNKYETTEAKVIKQWINKGKDIPDSIKVSLLKNGEKLIPEVSRTLNKNNEWAATVSGLDKYYENKLINYSWEEASIDHYYLSNVESANNITTLTNTYETYELETSYVGYKEWSDQDNIFNTRPNPDQVKIVLQRKIESDTDWTDLTLPPVWTNTDTNKWTYTFDHLQVFDENGNVYQYQAKEVDSGNYIGTITSNVPTNYSLGSISYDNGKERLTEDNKVVWTLSTTTDLAFVAIAPTAHGNCAVWSHRVATLEERAEIKRILDEGALPPATGRPIDYYSGTGANVYTPHGYINVEYDKDNHTVTLDFGDTSVWSQFIVGNFETNESEKYNVGTTDFKNSLETVDLSGTKTWSISKNSSVSNPSLLLTRTTSVSSAPEEVKVKDGDQTVLLQPSWSGSGDNLSYTYAELPAKDKEGNEYSYRVSEYRFVVNDVVYTVTKSETGDYIVTTSDESAPSFTVIQNNNNIVNTEVTDFEFSKIWKNATGQTEMWPSGKEITINLYAKTSDAEEGSLIDTVLLSPQRLPDSWSCTSSEDGLLTTFKVSNLPAADANGNNYEYYVVEETVPGYNDPIYTGPTGNTLINGNDRAFDGSHIINSPENGVEFPSTGGPGSNVIKLFGTAVMFIAITAFMNRKKRK